MCAKPCVKVPKIAIVVFKKVANRGSKGGVATMLWVDYWFGSCS